MTLNLKQLETFVWVATLGSFRRTADKLNTTQPNISVRISSFESELGVRLFDRDAGSVKLTAAGADLLEPAQRILATVDAFADQVGMAAQQSGVVRLGVTEIIVQTWLGQFLKQMRTLYPNTVIELVVDLAAELQKELLDRTIDLALMNGPFSDPTIQSVFLEEVPLIWVASPQISPMPKTLDDLGSHPVLSYSRKTIPYAELAEKLRTQPEQTVRIVPSNNVAACVQMTIDGLGIAALPAALITEHLESGRLVMLEFEWSPSPLRFCAYYAKTPSRTVIRNAAGLAQKIASENTS